MGQGLPINPKTQYLQADEISIKQVAGDLNNYTSLGLSFLIFAASAFWSVHGRHIPWKIAKCLRRAQDWVSHTLNLSPRSALLSCMTSHMLLRLSMFFHQ